MYGDMALVGDTAKVFFSLAVVTRDGTGWAIFVYAGDVQCQCWVTSYNHVITCFPFPKKHSDRPGARGLPGVII